MRERTKSTIAVIIITMLLLLAGYIEVRATCSYANCNESTTYTQIGNSTFGSDGSVATQIGSSTFISGGDSGNVHCTTIGNTTFCN